MVRILFCCLLGYLPAEGGRDGNTPPNEPEPRLRSQFYRNHKIADFVEKNTTHVVVTFFGPKCPLVPQIVPKLTALSKQYHAAGIRFLAVYSGTPIPLSEMASHAQTLNIPFPVLLDVEQRFARLYSSTRLTETLILDVTQPPVDGRYPAVYRGAIDDQMGVGSRKPAPLHHYLSDALEQIRSNVPVKVARTESEGCLIQFGKAVPMPGVTFHDHVKPILRAKCQSCHRPGEAGPMELITYADATGSASMIAELVGDRRMPPWPGESPLPLLDDHRLTPREVEMIRSWVETGMAEGDPKSNGTERKWPDPKAWRIGTPDLVFKTKSFTVPATGYLSYQYYLVPSHLTEDRYIQAIEVRTNAPRVVHHIQVLEGNPDPAIKETAGPVALDPVQQIKLHGFSLEDSKLLANYAPGNNNNVVIHPPEKGQKIRKGAILFFETHYTTNGTETPEESEVGIVWRTTPPEREIKTQWFYRNRAGFKIPAGEGHVRLEKDDIFVKNEDVRVLSLRMHQHARGKNFLIEKVSPRPHGGERVEPLVRVPIWDFNWQRTYAFKPDESGHSPVTLLGGESLRAIAHWDNTRWNPSNPDPLKDTYFGQQTKDEMMAVMMTYEPLTQAEVLAERRKRAGR